MGITSIKYYDLKQDRKQDYVFDFDKMLDTEGNTGVYLLFAYVRICSILRKAADQSKIDIAKLKKDKKAGFNITVKDEKSLALTILRLPEELDLVVAELKVNRLCEQLYETTKVISGFYSQCHVLGSDEEKSRVLLLEAVRKVLDLNFDLLGMKTIDKI